MVYLFLILRAQGCHSVFPFLAFCVLHVTSPLGGLRVIVVPSLWLSFAHVQMVEFFVFHMTQKDGMCLVWGSPFVSLVYIRQPELFVGIGEVLSCERCR